jgi:hypothetical protein
MSRKNSTRNAFVFERSDGAIVKTGQFTTNLTQGSVTCAYANVTP